MTIEAPPVKTSRVPQGHFIHFWLFLVVFILMAGCGDSHFSQRPTGDLLALLADPNQADRVRLDVLDELGRRPLDADRQREVGRLLGDLLQSTRNSPVIRARAIEELAVFAPQQAELAWSEALIHNPEPHLRNRMLDRLQAADDPRLLPSLIAALDGIAANDSPQEQTLVGIIEGIAAASLDQAAVSLLGDARQPPASRLAALRVLQGHIGRRAAVQRVLALPAAADDLVATLQFWARRFEYLPENLPRLLMCRSLTERKTPAAMAIVQQRHELLIRRRDDHAFDIRDGYLLASASESRIQEGRNRLQRRIEGVLHTRGHTKRPASYPGGPDDYREDFAGQADRLRYTDLLGIDYLLAGLERPETVSRLLVFLRQDRLDVQTEIGGLCFLKDARMEFRPYRPGRQGSDVAFHESAAMVADGLYCLARWHCHADSHQQRTRQADYSASRFSAPDGSDAAGGHSLWQGAELAGPGRDDLNYAAYINSPLVVISALGPNSCNLDYVTPEGIVIDLGNYGGGIATP
ncbi:MAG: hypothetical protein JW810_13755 [Sedimentisphaerales bacterium]|nr:hypothetical protein [Sedimentisphaerales bacterium]